MNEDKSAKEELEQIFHLLLDSTKVSTMPVNSSPLPRPTPIQSADRSVTQSVLNKSPTFIFDAACPPPTTIKHIWISQGQYMSQITTLKCCELYKLCFIWDLQSCLPPGAGSAGLASEASESSCQLFERAEVGGRGCECPIFS